MIHRTSFVKFMKVRIWASSGYVPDLETTPNTLNNGSILNKLKIRAAQSMNERADIIEFISII